MKRLATAFGLAADLAPYVALTAIGVFLLVAGIVPGALLQ